MAKNKEDKLFKKAITEGLIGTMFMIIEVIVISLALSLIFKISFIKIALMFILIFGMLISIIETKFFFVHLIEDTKRWYKNENKRKTI